MSGAAALTLGAADALAGAAPLLPMLMGLATAAAAIAAYLLHVRADALADDRLRWASTGFALTAAAMAVQLLGYPAYAPGGGPLGTTSTGAAGLYLLWHGALPVCLLAGLAAHRLPGWRSRRLRRTMAVAIVGAALVTAWGRTPLPVLVAPDGTFTPLLRGALALLAAGTLVAGVAWVRRGGVRDSWAATWVAAGLLLCFWDVAFHALSPERFDVTWWASLGMRVAQTVLPAFGLLLKFGAVHRDLERYATLVEERNRTLADRDVQLARARDEAEAASRAKTDFLATMSHEIRTPMNGVIGMAELLDATALTAEQRGYVDTLRRSGQALLALIDDVLDLSKVEGGHRELDAVAFDPRAVVEDVAALLAGCAARKGVALRVAVDGLVPPAVTGDPGMLRQVLTNLAGNAVKFTHRGEVRLALHALRASEDAVVLGLVVADTGIGIPADALDGLFDSFTQASAAISREYGGTGLGLAITRQLVELAGGSVEVRSTLGEGSAFACTLPMRPAEAALGQVPDLRGARGLVAAHPGSAVGDAAGLLGGWGAEALPPGARRHVVVADDDPTNRVVLTGMLQLLGFEVTSVADGIEAVAALEAGRVDAVVLDCQMPRMDGYTAAARIRAGSRQPDVPILGLTASVRTSDHDRAREAGMDQVATKPMTLEGLRALTAAWAPETAASATVLDADRTAELQGLGEDDFYPGLVGRFLDRAEDLLVEVERHHRDGHAAGLAEAAHALRGSAASLGAIRLAAAAGQVEDLARAGAPVPGARLYDLDTAWSSLRRVLTARSPAAQPGEGDP